MTYEKNGDIKEIDSAIEKLKIACGNMIDDIIAEIAIEKTEKYRKINQDEINKL